jgi:predicted RNA-binding protein (virulence factor B family)
MPHRERDTHYKGMTMAEIGRINTLTIKNIQPYGVHLDGGELGDILLLKKDVPENSKIGDAIAVFVYTDREDQLRATTRKPFAEVGQFAKLRVVANTESGSFMAWGQEKDLLVPKSEQQNRMVEGKSYVVFIFLSEKTKRITASSKLEQFLGLQPPNYQEGSEVDLIIWGESDLGYRAVVNQAHEGMVYKSEVFKGLSIGQEIKGYVKKIRDDSKIDLILQRPGARGIDDIGQTILKTIKDNGGRIGLTDKSKPEEIYAMFGVSKKVFKKAIGALYRKRLIRIGAEGIEISTP